jgi:hypothetical protein
MANANNIEFQIDGVPYIVNTGERLKLTQKGAAQNLGNTGDYATILEILRGKNMPANEACVYLEKEEEHDSWEEGLYLEVWVGDLVNWFYIEKAGPMVVNRDYKFRKQNLKGMRCRVLAPLGRDVVVEMEEDVGGSSADGIGKRGHCIPIKKEFLTVSSEKESSKE